MGEEKGLADGETMCHTISLLANQSVCLHYTAKIIAPSDYDREISFAHFYEGFPKGTFIRRLDVTFIHSEREQYHFKMRKL